MTELLAAIAALVTVANITELAGYWNAGRTKTWHQQ
jgi:hypothetical protein